MVDSGLVTENQTKTDWVVVNGRKNGKEANKIKKTKKQYTSFSGMQVNDVKQDGPTPKPTYACISLDYSIAGQMNKESIDGIE